MLVHRGGTKRGGGRCCASNVNTESALCHPLPCQSCCRPGGGAHPGPALPTAPALPAGSRRWVGCWSAGRASPRHSERSFLALCNQEQIMQSLPQFLILKMGVVFSYITPWSYKENSLVSVQLIREGWCEYIHTFTAL